jgi:hypothetical protein
MVCTQRCDARLELLAYARGPTLRKERTITTGLRTCNLLWRQTDCSLEIRTFELRFCELRPL